MRSLKIALLLIAAVLAASAAQADPVKIRLSYVVAPSDWAPLLPEKPDLLKHNGKSYQLEVVRVVGTPALVQAMANNEIEIGNHSYSSLGIAIQNAGMDDLRVISDQFQDGVPGKSTTVTPGMSFPARSRIGWKRFSQNPLTSSVGTRISASRSAIERLGDVSEIERRMPSGGMRSASATISALISSGNRLACRGWMRKASSAALPPASMLRARSFWVAARSGSPFGENAEIEFVMMSPMTRSGISSAYCVASPAPKDWPQTTQRSTPSFVRIASKAAM